MTYEEPEDSADPEHPSSASAQHPALAGWSTADERSFWGFHDDRYKPYLHFAYKQLGSDADAEDAADKTFDEIMNNWQRMLGMEDLPGYAWSILKSRISDQRRKRDRQALPTDLSAFAAVVDGRDDFAAMHGRLQFAQAIEHLSERQRDAVILRFGLDLDTAAKSVECRFRPFLGRGLATAPTPAKAAKLIRRRLQSLLKQAGRVRGIQGEAERLHEVFSRDYLHQLPQVEAALGHQTSALLRQLDTACDNADQLEEAVTQAFEEHPDAPVIRSFPGLAALTGARVLAEIGDDRTRFATAGSLKAYAGSAPVTRASGKSCKFMSRKVKNQRLAAVGYVWAFGALTRSPGARAHYDRRRAAGDRHVAAQRNLFNRFMGMLFHCLQNGHPYDEEIAFPQASAGPKAAAA
ncbi:transposase [Streptomyces sp. NBC_00555]|uniref:transposase n=1 Tax=Streptomyces sp. NBC_00555 TaxID=2903662 RepID=UPI00225593FD|nr:transposase [Streptomyces sp. NBC_00555]MCX5014924.1 transposase [Streptomyces sp. NBC_00555]